MAALVNAHLEHHPPIVDRITMDRLTQLDDLLKSLVDMGLIEKLATLIADRLTTPIAPLPKRMTRSEIASAMHRTATTIDRWVAAGMPCEDLGSYRLFDPAACMAWASRRAKPGRPVKRAPAALPDNAPAPELRTRVRRSA